jgi:hypothetical protein
MQHLPKGPASFFTAAAGARVFAAQFFQQFLVAMHEAQAALDAGFGWVAFAPFTGGREKRRRGWCSFS